jgi:hypothetical protein
MDDVTNTLGRLTGLPTSYKEIAMVLSDKGYGFWIVVGGLVALLGVSMVAVFRYSGSGDAAGVITAVGTVVGTLVGTFFGVQVGSSSTAAGAQKGQAAQDKAQQLTQSVLTGLSNVAVHTPEDSLAAAAITDMVNGLPSPV